MGPEKSGIPESQLNEIKRAYVQACRDALAECNYFCKLMVIMDSGLLKEDTFFDDNARDFIFELRPYYLKWIIPAGPEHYISLFMAENRFIKAD